MTSVIHYRDIDAATKRWSRMEREAPVVARYNGLPVTAADLDTAPSEYCAPEQDPA